jgi:hypothetical protein
MIVGTTMRGLTFKKSYQEENVERWFLHGKIVISESLPPWS